MNDDWIDDLEPPKAVQDTVEIIEEPTFTEQYLPSAQEVSTTITVAIAATAAVFGKPLAELLLKIIRPAVKKIVQKAKDKVGSRKRCYL